MESRQVLKPDHAVVIAKQVVEDLEAKLQAAYKALEVEVAKAEAEVQEAEAAKAAAAKAAE